MEERNNQITVDGKDVEMGSREQTVVKVTDRGGQSINFQMIDGVHYSPLNKTNLLKGARCFKMRTDDVYFPGYLRTGTHWTFERTRMLLNGNAETIRRFKDHMELLTQDEIDQLPSPRIVNSHLPLSNSPDDVGLMKLKVLYTIRDPKDVVVSMYYLYYGRSLFGEKYMGSFGDYLQLFLKGTIDNNGYFYHMLDAEKFFRENPDVPVHFEIYEEAMKDPLKAVQNLSDFLGLSRNNDLCQEIAEKCKFSRMRVDKDDYAMKIDGVSFLYRNGTVGDWRNHFTPEMLDDYYRVYDEKMAGSRFYKQYTRDKD